MNIPLVLIPRYSNYVRRVPFSDDLLLSYAVQRIHDCLDARKSVVAQADWDAMGIIYRGCSRNIATFEGIAGYIQSVVAVPQPFLPISDQDAIPGFVTLDDLISGNSHDPTVGNVDRKTSRPSQTANPRIGSAIVKDVVQYRCD